MTEPTSSPPGSPGSLVPPRTSGSAVAALAIAIASWFVCPLIGGIVALVLAGSAAREIRCYQGALAGAGMVTAARIIAWTNLLIMPIVVLWVLSTAGVIGAGLWAGLSTAPAEHPPSATVPWTPPTTDPRGRHRAGGAARPGRR
jgi:hypothetical protein